MADKLETNKYQLLKTIEDGDELSDLKFVVELFHKLGYKINFTVEKE